MNNSKEEANRKAYSFSVITISKEGNILSVDESFSHLFHFSSEEAIGKNVALIFSDTGEFQKRFLSEYGKKHRVTGRSKHGAVFGVEMTVSEVPTGMGSTIIIVALHLMPSVVRSKSAPSVPSSSNLLSSSPVRCGSLKEDLLRDIVHSDEKINLNKRGNLQLHANAAYEDDEFQQEQSSSKSRRIEEISFLPQYFVGPYQIESLIDSSGRSTVYKAIHRVTHEVVAMKLKDKMLGEQHIQAAIREFEIGRSLSHPNIVKYLDCIHTSTDICIITEYCESGNLEAYTRKKQKLSEDEAKVFSWQLVDAVQYCHERHVKHGDIKLPNILIKDGNAKLTDFDASKHAQGERSTFVGTPAYISPEMLLRSTYNGEEADVWGIGVCLYVMVTGTYPFDSLQQTLSGQFTIPEGLSPECVSLIKGMLHKDTTQRLNIKQVKNHPFLTSAKFVNRNTSRN